MDRSPRAVHELQQSIAQLHFTDDHSALANYHDYNDHNDHNEHDNFDDYEEYDDSDDNDSFDDAAPPPIPSGRSTPQDLKLPPREPRSAFNPLQSHPVASSTVTATVPNPRHRFSHPLRQRQEAWRKQEEARRQQQEKLRQQEEAYLQQEEALLQQQETLRQHQEALRKQQDALRRPNPAPEQPSPAPRRHPSKLQSYRSAKPRFNPHLRQRTSLETIASVATTPSLYDPLDAEPPSSDLPTLEDESPGPTAPTSTPVMSPSRTSSTRSASISSTLSSGTATRSVESVEKQPPRSLLHKLNPSKRSESSSEKTPERLVIERKVSIGRTSQPSNSSSAALTISSGEPSSTGNTSPEVARSQSSSEWKASEHDISGLSAEELKKCKKKGINPALYAEMKAARKGKWMSPISGNTFLS